MGFGMAKNDEMDDKKKDSQSSSPHPRGRKNPSQMQPPLARR